MTETYDRSFNELRTGFTAAVSHELRTPLARILALLETATLPGADVQSLIDQARDEVESAGGLIDEILFLSELESGNEIVSLTPTDVRPVLDEVVDRLGDRAARAGVALAVHGDGAAAAAPAHAPHRRRESRRERDSLRGPRLVVCLRARARPAGRP